MKSIHAFSALLPGQGTRFNRGTSLAIHPEKGHAPNLVKANGERALDTGRSRLSALSSLLAIALFQSRSTPRRPRD